MIDGNCDARFAVVRDAFAAGFDDHPAVADLGACVAVSIGGRLVVDLWGGHLDPAKTKAWSRHTIVDMMSVGKAMLALVTHRLAERGALELDAPVARWWPEFAQAGKDGLKLRHVLDHRAGLAVCEAARPGDAHDWKRFCTQLAAQAPAAMPGTTPIYHSLTYGFLLGEVMRRVTGRPFRDVWRDEVSGPLGVDYAFCRTNSDDLRCAVFLEAKPATPPDPRILAVRTMRGLDAPEDRNARRHRAAELYAINGHGNARAMATIYDALASGETLWSRTTRAHATSTAWHETEAVTGKVVHMGLGFRLPDDVGISGGPRAFGHGGRGGATCFGDPDARLGFAYAPNRAYPGGSAESPHARRLRDAVYACLGAT
ncbi:MAG: beta-lactamase family protein [Alphaproteobacteria bacterium]|nr:beta-lactamase family protein [Alphaproteobacteria bacterium]